MVPVAVITLLGVVIKVSVRDEAIINMALVVELLVIAVSDDVEIVIAIVLKFPLPVSEYPVDAPSDMDINLFIETLTDVMIGVVAGVVVEALAGVTANAFAVMNDFGFPV